MAPSRARRAKQRDDRLWKRTVQWAAKQADNTPPVTPPDASSSSATSDDESTSCSIPESPAVEPILVYQSGPSVSTDSDIHPFLLPPLNYHNNAKKLHATEAATEQISNRRAPKQSKAKEGLEPSANTTEKREIPIPHTENLAAETQSTLAPHPLLPDHYPHLENGSRQYPQHFRPMSNPNGFPPGYAYGAPRAGSPYGSSSPPYPHPRTGSPLPRQDSTGSKISRQGDPPPQATEDDPTDLVARISSVIPDLSMLLSRHKETHGELSLREQLLRKAEAQTAEVVKQKEEHINQLMRQLQSNEKLHAGESNKYRLQIGNLEDKQKELEERLSVAELSRKVALKGKHELEAQNATLMNDRMVLTKATAEERSRLITDFEKSRLDAEKALEEQKRETADASAQRKELDTELSKARAELEAAVKTEQDNQRQWNTEREDLTKKLEQAQAAANGGSDERSDALIKKHEEEMTTQIKNHDEEMTVQVKKHEEEMEALSSQYKEDRMDILRSFIPMQASLNMAMTAENEMLKEQMAQQKVDWENEKEELKRMLAEVQDATQDIDAEKGRLQTLMECFGDNANKDKGDTY